MKFERLLLPGGTIIISTHVSLDYINKLGEKLGIPPKVDKMSTAFDIAKSLTCRLEYLESKGLLSPCVNDRACLLV